MLSATVKGKQCQLCIVLSHLLFDSPSSKSELLSSMILLPLCDSTLAMSLAASSLRRARKPLLALTASPMSSAERASPWARTMIDCFSWIAWSTRKAARWAVCWAICLAVGSAREEEGK